MEYRKQQFIDIHLFVIIPQLRPIAVYHRLNYMKKYCVSL
jgi:hypothetical protein